MGRNIAGREQRAGPSVLVDRARRPAVARRRHPAAARRPHPTGDAQVRVVAGTARGRRLVAPKGTDVRPTTDRVREATFNSLASMGVLEGARVLDLFAGSGALGIEALSRGAAHVSFVDSSAAALRAVEENLHACGLSDAATLHRGDALDHLRRHARDTTPSAPWDLALLDPPYTFARWDDVLSLVRAQVLVIESDREVELPSWVEVRRVRRYGGTVVTIATDVDPEGHPRRSPEDRS